MQRQISVRICFKKVIQTFLKSKTRKFQRNGIFVFSGKQILGDFIFRSTHPCTEGEAVLAAILKQLLKLSVLMLALYPAFSNALPEDREQPINLQADQASFDQRTGVSVYQGRVEVSQGTMYLAADKATVYFDQDGVFQRMEAVGSPTRFRYQPSRKKPRINGVGDKIEYDAVKAKVFVSGNAKFTQGSDSFTGSKIEYDLTSDVVSASSQPGKRVQFTIQPRKD